MKNIFILLVTLFSYGASAQVDTSRYYENYLETRTGADGAIYLVKIYKDSGNLWRRDVFTNSDQVLYSSGTTNDNAGKVRHGLYTYFHTNGNKMKSGIYANGKREGEWVHFSNKGMLLGSYHYHEGSIVGSNRSWYENGNIDDSIMLDNAGNGVAMSFYKSGNLRLQGTYKAGRKTGAWEYFYEQPARSKSMEATFANDSLIASKCYTVSGTVQTGECIYEREAEFPGGPAGWRNYLVNNMPGNFDKHMKKGMNKYKVMVRFIVSKDGKLSDISIEQPDLKKLDKMAIKLLENSPDWIPAIQYNQPVNAYRRQPITFMRAE